MTDTDIFSRSRLLLGDEAMALLDRRSVIVFGVGGVGSWCAESLVRTGLRHLTIVDCDRVAASNVNRQLMATTATIGEVKVEALRRRLLQINPAAEVTAVERVFSEATLADFFPDGGQPYDYVIDAIDSLADKALLILTATRRGITLFSSMGAALKLDPTRIGVAEFWHVKGDPLARALRNRFKRAHTFPACKFKCVFSDEPPVAGASVASTPQDVAAALPLKRQINGSLVHITAIFGNILANLVVRDILQAAHPAPAITT